MTHFLRILRRDERGGAIIEMALVAPFMAALIVGMSDMSRAYSQKIMLEQAGQRAIEKIMQSTFATTVAAALKAEAAQTAGVPLDNVTVKYWLECDGVSKYRGPSTMDLDYNGVCNSGQKYARYLEVDIAKTYTPLFTQRFAAKVIHGRAGIRVQ